MIKTPAEKMRNTICICLLILTACTTSKNIYQVAKKKGLTVRSVAGIKFPGGLIRIDGMTDSYKGEPLYLLFNGNILKYISTDKRVANGEFMYAVEKVGDSIYQLTRSTRFPRYFYEDTVLFHTNYVVSSRCLYEDAAKRDFVHSEFYHYYYTTDSLVQLSFGSINRLPSILEYGRNIPFTENSIKQSEQWKMPRYREEDLLKYIRP